MPRGYAADDFDEIGKRLEELRAKPAVTTYYASRIGDPTFNAVKDPAAWKAFTAAIGGCLRGDGNAFSNALCRFDSPGDHRCVKSGTCHHEED